MIPISTFHSDKQNLTYTLNFCKKIRNFQYFLPCYAVRMTKTLPQYLQLILRSTMRYYAKGSIIADCRDEAKALMVITAGQVGGLMCAIAADVYHANLDTF
jgi:hypothetical protein